MDTISVARGRAAGKEWTARRREPAQRTETGQLRGVVCASQQILKAWCRSEAEMRDSGVLTDERVAAITSLAMSGDSPFMQ